MAADELHEPQGPAPYTYLTFKLGPGELQRLVIRIWSNDQGWCDDHLKIEDPYANSYTWFSLGLVKEPILGQENQIELHDFQRNVRASSTMRCHTNEWNLGIPAEDDCGEVHAWIESLAQAEGSVIGVFPRAKYSPSWVNSVWKMEVLVKSKSRHNSQTPKPQTGCGDTIDTTMASSCSSATRIIGLEEEVQVMSTAIQLALRDYPNYAANLNDIANQFHSRYTRTNALELLEGAISIARQAVKATPEDHPNQAALLNNLGLKLGDKYLRTRAVADLEEAIRIARQAVKATPEDHPNQAALLNNLGLRLGDRYSRTGAMADLEEAIRIARQAVKATPEGHPDRAGRLNNLGLRLGDRYLRTGAMADDTITGRGKRGRGTNENGYESHDRRFPKRRRPRDTDSGTTSPALPARTLRALPSRVLVDKIAKRELTTQRGRKVRRSSRSQIRSRATGPVSSGPGGKDDSHLGGLPARNLDNASRREKHTAQREGSPTIPRFASPRLDRYSRKPTPQSAGRVSLPPVTTKTELSSATCHTCDFSTEHLLRMSDTVQALVGSGVEPSGRERALDMLLLFIGFIRNYAAERLTRNAGIAEYNDSVNVMNRNYPKGATGGLSSAETAEDDETSHDSSGHDSDSDSESSSSFDHNESPDISYLRGRSRCVPCNQESACLNSLAGNASSPVFHTDVFE